MHEGRAGKAMLGSLMHQEGGAWAEGEQRAQPRVGWIVDRGPRLSNTIYRCSRPPICEAQQTGGNSRGAAQRSAVLWCAVVCCALLAVLCSAGCAVLCCAVRCVAAAWGVRRIGGRLVGTGRRRPRLVIGPELALRAPWASPNIRAACLPASWPLAPPIWCLASVACVESLTYCTK